MKTLAILQGLIISLAVMGVATLSAQAQGICVADTLTVTSISGRVIAKLNKGETPLDEAVVILKRGGNSGPIIAKRKIKEDGSFSFNRVRHGTYQLQVSAIGLRDFYLNLKVKRLKFAGGRKEIVVIMGADFTKECAGSYAELRIKKKG